MIYCKPISGLLALSARETSQLASAFDIGISVKFSSSSANKAIDLYFPLFCFLLFFYFFLIETLTFEDCGARVSRSEGGLSKTDSATRSKLGLRNIESMSLPTIFLGDTGGETTSVRSEKEFDIVGHTPGEEDGADGPPTEKLTDWKSGGSCIRGRLGERR